MDDKNAPYTTHTHGAAKRIGLAVSTLEKLRLTGEGPPFAKLGSRVIYRFSDLDAWLAARIVTSTSDRSRGVIDG